MYDSRSDHPHKGVHGPRSWREMGRGDHIDYGTPRPRLLATPDAERLALAEGLADCEPDPDERYTDERYTYAAAVRVAEIEAQLWAMTDHTEPEHMAPWEVALLTGMDQDQAEDVAWSSVYDPRDQVHLDVLVDDDEDLDGEDQSAWLTASPHEFFDAVGDGWVVEGPSPCRTSDKAGGYVRVYELAREARISTSDMVTALRVRGEYVANGLAYVAVPVADRIREEAPTLWAAYGVHRSGPSWAEQMEDLRAKVTRPAPRPAMPSLRPGGPRPGNNPFSTHHLTRSH